MQATIDAAIIRPIWNTNSKYFGLKVLSTQEQAQKSLYILEKMLKCGVDLNYKRPGLGKTVNESFPSKSM
ncbi:MAG: hypothetical protein Q4E75_03205 [bacterium]|nr:hypothetical protein [bacterium]